MGCESVHINCVNRGDSTHYKNLPTAGWTGKATVTGQKVCTHILHVYIILTLS